ncbi:uncharacterized protein YALI1_F14072g [Yarrowia lipolytica]|uniref:Uncharacterized protein n=1 Tax=Yarrowia lipolytica TaxID=4952 RepID=A0A1D8NMR6_YARLL|nr:hypothetical protein YALI1_F14072g [Yarrowia lipolytica]
MRYLKTVALSAALVAAHPAASNMEDSAALNKRGGYYHHDSWPYYRPQKDNCDPKIVTQLVTSWKESPVVTKTNTVTSWKEPATVTVTKTEQGQVIVKTVYPDNPKPTHWDWDHKDPEHHWDPKDPVDPKDPEHHWDPKDPEHHWDPKDPVDPKDPEHPLWTPKDP